MLFFHIIFTKKYIFSQKENKERNIAKENKKKCTKNIKNIKQTTKKRNNKAGKHIYSFRFFVYNQYAWNVKRTVFCLNGQKTLI